MSNKDGTTISVSDRVSGPMLEAANDAAYLISLISQKHNRLLGEALMKYVSEYGPVETGSLITSREIEGDIVTFRTTIKVRPRKEGST